jgi:hypothetical protein
MGDALTGSSGSSLRAHRAILSACSTKMKDMLNRARETKEFVFNNENAAVFKDTLRRAYHLNHRIPMQKQRLPKLAPEVTLGEGSNWAVLEREVGVLRCSHDWGFHTVNRCVRRWNYLHVVFGHACGYYLMNKL